VSSHQRMRAVIIIVTAADACDARLIACGDCYHGSERVQCTSYVMRTSGDSAWCSCAHTARISCPHTSSHQRMRAVIMIVTAASACSARLECVR
jgi:hypothetical protein